MDAFLISTGIVALAEIGDKTQLLAFILAAKFRKPVPIIIGILVATLANHGLAGAVGTWLTSLMSPETLRWVLGLSFIAMAVWTLIPDKIDEDDHECRNDHVKAIRRESGVPVHAPTVHAPVRPGSRTA